MARLQNWRKNGELRWEHTGSGDYISIDQLGKFAGAGQGDWRVQAFDGFNVQKRTFNTKREAKQYASKLARNNPNGL